MSWLQRLYQTYELASQNEELQAQETNQLMPYYHVNQNVQIIVTINDKGDFIHAEVCVRIGLITRTLSIYQIILGFQ